MSTPNLKTGRFSAPVDGTTSAHIHLGLSAGEMTVRAGSDPASLIDAEVAYLGEIDFRVLGDAEKSVVLSQKAEWMLEWFNPANWSAVSDLRWTVNLSPAVPLHLEINGGVGRCHFDLSGLNLTALTVNGGAGEIDLVLPAMDAPYEATVNGGMGEIEIEIAPGAAINLNVRSGVGKVDIDTPADAAVHIDARFGLGETQAGARFTRVSGSESDLPFAQHSVWETPGFAGAARPIAIRFEGGVGSLNVR